MPVAISEFSFIQGIEEKGWYFFFEQELL